MSFRNAKGEGKFGAIVGVVVLILAIYAIVNAGSVYLTDYRLQDKIEVAALGLPTAAGDKLSHKKIMLAITELELQEYLSDLDVKVRRVGSNRKIDCSYEREVKFLPGFSKMITFTHTVNQPVF